VPISVKLSLVILLPVLLFFIPVDWLNGQHTLCLFKNLTGRECWGCGITRAIISAVQFHFEAAFHYNKLIVIVLPLLLYEWIKTVKSLVIQFFKLHLTHIRVKQKLTT
jgi:hypothetical protein